MLEKFLDNLRKKPEKERKRLLWISVSFLGLAVFLLWIFVMPHESTVPPEKTQETKERLEKTKQDIKEYTDKINFSDVTSDLKGAVGDAVKKEKPEERVVEYPRLPIEAE